MKNSLYTLGKDLMTTILVKKSQGNVIVTIKETSGPSSFGGKSIRLSQDQVLELINILKNHTGGE